MAAKGNFRTTLRWLFWPVIVVGALNIENRATRAGYGDVSFNDILGSLRMTQIYQEITSDTALYIVLFLGGGCTFAWISYLLERAETRWEGWALRNLSLECQQLAKNIVSPLFPWLIPGAIRRLNVRLERFGFDALPSDYDRRDKERNRRTARYLQAIAPIMEKDLELAQRLGQTALNLATERAVARRSPQGTGSGTLP